MTLKEFKNIANMAEPSVHLQLYMESFFKEFNPNQKVGQDIEIIKSAGAIILFCTKFGLDNKNILKNINHDSSYSNIREYINRLYKSILFNNANSSFDNHFQSITYEFTDEELTSLNDTIDDLTNKIKESNLFEEQQLKMILDLLNRLKKEVNKDIHSMTTIFGTLAELGLKFNLIPKAKKIFSNYIAGLFKITINVNVKANNLPITDNIQIPFSAEDEIIEMDV